MKNEKKKFYILYNSVIKLYIRVYNNNHFAPFARKKRAPNDIRFSAKDNAIIMIMVIL